MKNINTRITFLCIALALAWLTACEDDDANGTKLGVDFSAGEQNVSAGGTVQFTDLSIGSPSKWNWKFEGGTPPTSTLQNPTVTYESPGTYSVTLDISYKGKTATLTKEEFVAVASPEVEAGFSVSKTTAIQGDNVVFTDLSTGNPTTWEWKFIPTAGTTITSSEQNPVIAFTEPGVYTVMLTASNDENSNQEVKADYLTVIDNTAVEAGFTASAKNTYTGVAVSYSDASVGTATAWSWTFEGGTPATSTDRNPTVTYSTPGRYKVTLEASNDTKSSIKEADDYILVVPGTDLAAFYPFDGNGNDLGPNSAAPTQVGTVVYTGTDRNALANGTAVFDGASVLVVPDHSAFNFGTTDFTIGCWVKTAIQPATKMMVWMESGANGTDDKQTWLRMNDNDSNRRLRFDVEDASGGKILNMGPDVTDDAWHFIVCVREGLVSRVYIDGALELESTGTVIKDVSSDQPFKIGAQETGGGGSYNNYFNGQIDDLVIYNRALDVTEVNELFGL